LEIFRSDDNDQSGSSDTNADNNAGSDTGGSNDGLSLSTESSDQSDDGASSSDSTNLDVGGADAGNGLDVNSILDNMTSGDSSSESDSGLDN
jgi:hypothetical protein